jgi:PHP family Zn ribbon phosphoesterase
MAVKYKIKCIRCKKNYVLSSYRQRNNTCEECQEKDMKGEVTDPALKKLLDIPEAYYKENSFLRNIKIAALRYGKLTDRQIEVFKDVAQKLVDRDSKKDDNSSKKRVIT